MKIISLRTALFFSVAVFSFVLGNAQNLTISTSGQTTSPGTNWSISGNVLNVAASGSAEIHPSVITNHLLNSGNLTINLPWQSGAARSVNINASIAYTGSAARTLTINCANDIVFANAVGITSATASLNVVLRSAIGLSLGAPDHGLVKMDGINIDTKGGNLWVGGGTTSTSWNGLTVGNSYAVTWLDDVSGISLIGSTLNTAGGHIALYAQSFNSGDDDGINYGINIENSNISSGSGSIYMAGGLYGKYTVGIGMRIVGTTGTSISSSTGAIDIYGYGTDAASAGNAWRHAAFVNGSVSIKSTSGSITLFGQAAFNSAVIDKEGLVIGDGVVVASQTGSILLKGTNTLESSGQYSNSIRFAAANVTNSIRVGFDGTNAYSGNITIEGNSIYQRSTHSGAGSIAVQTTGTLTIQPTGNSFTYMRAGDDGAGATLSYDDDWNFGTTLGGFVYGKTTNTTALTYSNALTTNGPITMYTGAHVQNAAVSSSAAITFHSADFTLGNGINIATNTASAITINANGNFTSEGTIRRTISSANGTITIHADKDANGSGDLSIDYITFNSGTGNVIIRFETVNWAFGSGQEPYFNGTGNITIEPSDPSFPYAIYSQWFNFDQDNNGFSGLTLGKSGNAFDIIHSGSALSVAGPVTMFGANIAISSALSTTSATGHIRLNATADITPTAAMTTQGGTVVLWADTDGASGGRMSLSSSITTNGGSIYAGGGSASETQNGIVVPTGYATSSNNSLSGITVAGSTINSGGGSIRLKGSNNSVDGNNAGLIVSGNTTISSGAGSLSLFGQRTGNPNTSAGLFIGTEMNASAASGNVSISATSGNIYLEGITTSISNTYSWCHGLAIVEYFGDDVSITSTTGNISMFGDATSAAAFSGEAVGLVIQSGSTTSLTNIATDGGTILINGKSSNAGFDYGSSYRGANTAGNISIGDNNTGNITLQFGSLSGNSNVGSVALQSAGAYVLEGNSAAAFGTAIELTNAYTFGSSATSFRLGSTNNNQNVTVSTPVSVAGPVSVYGGNVFTQQNLTSTASGAAILLQATGYIDVSTGDIIQTSGGNITLRSNSSGVPVVLPNVTTGSITLNSGSSLLSNGGNITLGGNFTGTQGQGLYAASNRVGGSPGIVINNATLTAAGGNINIYGKCTSSYDDGVRLQATITTTGAGNIGIYGDAWGGYNGTEFFGGISFFNEISRIETENGDVTLEGILTNSSHAQGYALSFYRSTGLTGQTKHIQILSKTGDIQITANPGTSIGKGMGHSSWGNIYFGSPSNNNYIATGSIKFIYSSLVNAANNGFKVKTSGPVTYEPIANSFVADQDFPPTTHYVLADGASSLTIGKAVNTSNIYLQEPISIPGSINVYGGNLYLYDDIASTGGGNISILGASSVYTSGLASITRDLTTTGGTIRVEADSDADGTGLLNIDYMSFNPGNGSTILRGELFSFETSSETIKPNINGSGTFTLESNDGNFGQDIQLVWFKIANTITGVTVGKQSSNTFTYLNSTNGLTINGPVTINGSSIEISTPLSLTNNLSLRASGAVTQTLAGTVNSVGLALNGTGTVTLTNTANNFVTIAGGAVGSLIGATQIIDASGGLTIGTVGSNTGLLGSGTIRVETLAGNLTLAGNISTTNATTDAVILTAAKSTAIGTPAGGDILVTGSPTITMATGGIAKLYSGYDMTSTGLSTFVGTSNVRYNYDETSTTFNPALSANNKYAFYRAGQGYGDLNIVSTAGDAEGSTWSYANGVITTISGTANVSNTAIQNKLNSGNLSIEANKITFSANITGTTSNSLSILSKTHIVNTNATTITTLGGDVLFASNVDDATDGENTVNGYIVLTSGLTMNTNGGDIAFGGGNNSGTDYALGTSVYPYEGIRFDGIINLNSGGGNISMRGKSYAIATTAGAWGVGFWNLSTGSISSGTGAITLDGFSQASGGSHSSGLYTHGALTITSENTTADAIRLIGKCTANGGEAWGIEAESALSLLATGTGGGITLSSSQQNSANNYDIVLRGETNILAKSGPISMLGGQSGGLTTGTLLLGNNLFLGSKASSAVLTSTSNITIQYHLYNFSGYTPKLATSGTLNWKPVTTSFGQAVETAWFSWNQNSQNLSGLTIGQTGNEANVYLNSAITVAGPINLYGGYVNVSGTLTSSGNSDILLKGIANSNASVLINGGITKTGNAGTLLMQGHGRVQTNGVISATGTGILNLVMWSDYDGDNVGGGSTLGAGGSISTNGGHVWMGGSSSNGGTYTWNGLSVGDGPSVGATNCNCHAIDLFGPITTNGGSVLLWAGSSAPGCGTSGIVSDGVRHINAGSGDITLITDETASNIELTSSGVISLVPHAGSYASALTLGGTLTSGHFTFNSSPFTSLKIYSLANTGLVVGQYAGHSNGGTSVLQGNTSTVTASTALSTKSLGIYGGSVITSAALTAAGNIILDADNGNFLSQNTKGVEVNAVLTTTNNGNITIHGRGGSTTGIQTHGINVTNLIDAGGTGIIELIGYGGLSFDNATGSSCHGVNIEGANAWVKSNGGNVVINGYGGGAGAGTYSQGVPLLTNAKVSAAGSGTVTITGTGGVNTAIGLRGVVLTSGSSVYSSGGAITITGVAGTYGSDNSDGISMETVTIGNTSTGSILLSGQPGGGSGSEAISMNGTNTIGAASHNNTIVLRGNNLSIAGTNSVLTTGQVTIEPHSTSFSNALSFPIANLSIASTITGLTLGKSSNSSAITLTTAANINGPINIYGGAVALNGNLTTLNNTTGDILIKANTLSGTPAISVANNRSLTFDLAQSTTYSGSVAGTNINLIKTGVGTLGFGSTLPISANVITQAGTLQFTSNQSVADVEMNGGTLIIDDTKKLTINGDFTALAAGTLQNNGTIELVGPESFPGLNTNISAMKNLEVNRSAGVLLNNALTLTGALTLTSGVLDLNNNTLTHAGTALTKTNGKIDASTGVLAFANDQTALTLPTGLFVPDALTGVAEVAEIFKSAGAATVTVNEDLTVTGALRTAASTGALVLGIGTELNLNGNFINNGAITFDTLATVLQGTSSQASGTGVYNVRQKVTGSSANGQANGRFWYLGSAVANAQASAVMTANANKIYHWEANQASPSWIELTDANAVLQTGKGYSIRMGDQSVLNFSGSAMHNNTLQIPSYRQTTGSFQGYNLITNPYLSYLDWETVWQGSNAVNFQPTIWYRLANNTNVMVFDTYNAQSNIGTSNNSANGSTSVTRYIPPMQAVWMRLNTGVTSANLMVDNSARSHYTAVQGGLTAGLKTTAQDFPAFVRLNLIQGTFQDQTIVYLKDAAAASYDNFDSDKMFLTGYPQVYSQVAGKKLVINGLKDNKKVTVVPLFIDIPAAGNYTFKASELNIENGLILLEDKLEGVLQDLTINDTYQFAAASGTTSNRFYLRIILPNNQPIAQGPTSNWVSEEVTYTEGGTILVSSDGAGRVMVTQQVTEAASGIVLVRDAAGRLVFEGETQGAQTIFTLEQPSGLYFVEVQIGNTSKIEKIVLR